MPSPPRAVCDGIRTSLHILSPGRYHSGHQGCCASYRHLTGHRDYTHNTPFLGETALLQSPKCGRRILPKGKRRVFCLGRHCLFEIRLSPGPSYMVFRTQDKPTPHINTVTSSLHFWVLPAHFWAILLCLQHHGVSEAGLLVISHNNLPLNFESLT